MVVVYAPFSLAKKSELRRGGLQDIAWRPRRPRPLIIPNVGVVVSFALISKCQWMEHIYGTLCTSVGELLFVVCCCFCCCFFVLCL